MNNKLIKTIAVPFFALALISFLGFCLITNSAGTLRVYFPTDLPFVYRLNQSIPASYIPPIERGADVWTNLEGSYFAFQRGENTTASTVSRDGINLVFFDLQGANFSNPNVIAFSSTFTTGGQGFKAYESDLVWNARDFPPAVNGIGGIDLEGTMAHEFGHHMGIDHTGLPTGASSGCGPLVPAATMWYAVSQNDTTQRSLHPEDIIAAAALYPNFILEGTVKESGNNNPINGAIVSMSRGYGALVGNVENPIGSRFNRPGYILTEIPTNNNGFYKSIVTHREFNITIDAFGYAAQQFPVLFSEPSGFGNTQTLVFNADLVKNPIVPFAGTVLDTVYNLPINAELEFYWVENKTNLIESISTNNGSFTVNIPSDEYYYIKLKMNLPYQSEVYFDSVFVPNSGLTFNLNISPMDVLLVLNDNVQTLINRFVNGLDLTEKPYGVWKKWEQKGVPSDNLLNSFKKPLTIIWSAGADTFANISSDEIELLKNHLRSGNRLLLTGKNIVQYLQEDSLIAHYAGVNYTGENTTLTVRGITGDPVGNGISFAAVGAFKDVMDLNGSNFTHSYRSMQYGNNAADTTRLAGVRFEHPGYKFKGYLLGFGVESIGSDVNAGLFLERVLTYLADTSFTVTNINDDIFTPLEYSLEQNYPNPFNPVTSINFSIPKSEFVTLKIYNSVGEEVAVLVNKELNAGFHSVNFDAGKLASGVYYYRIKSGSFTETKKMVLLK